MFNNIFSKKKISKKINNQKQKIIVDYREKNSLVPSELIKNNLEIEFKELKVGDYLINNTIIERKTQKDFVASIIDKRIFRQLEEIKQYTNFLLIIEGNLENTSLHENQIKGMILSISLNFKVPIVFSKNEEETATYIKLISQKSKKESGINPKKKTFSDEEKIKFIIESFPNIGPKTGEKLLIKFKTIKKTINAKEEELKEILGKKTKDFLKIIEKEFKF